MPRAPRPPHPAYAGARVPPIECPVRVSLDGLGRKWTLILLCHISLLGGLRFSDMLRMNQGLTPRVLSIRLGEMRKEGLIARSDAGADGRSITYSATPKGLAALPIVMALVEYGVQHKADKVFADGIPRTLGDIAPEGTPSTQATLPSRTRAPSRR